MKMFDPKPGPDGKTRESVEEMRDPGCTRPAVVSGIGGYNDWLVKVNDHWLFKRREILKADPDISF